MDNASAPAIAALAILRPLLTQFQALITTLDQAGEIEQRLAEATEAHVGLTAQSARLEEVLTTKRQQAETEAARLDAQYRKIQHDGNQKVAELRARLAQIGQQMQDDAKQAEALHAERIAVLGQELDALTQARDETSAQLKANREALATLHDQLAGMRA